MGVGARQVETFDSLARVAQPGVNRQAVIRQLVGGVPVTSVKEREVFARASTALGMAGDELKRRLAELGRQLGPPWREDQKLATLVAWFALS